MPLRYHHSDQFGASAHALQASAGDDWTEGPAEPCEGPAAREGEAAEVGLESLLDLLQWSAAAGICGGGGGEAAALGDGSAAPLADSGVDSACASAGAGSVAWPAVPMDSDPEASPSISEVPRLAGAGAAESDSDARRGADGLQHDAHDPAASDSPGAACSQSATAAAGVSAVGVAACAADRQQDLPDLHDIQGLLSQLSEILPGA